MTHDFFKDVVPSPSYLQGALEAYRSYDDELDIRELEEATLEASKSDVLDYVDGEYSALLVPVSESKVGTVVEPRVKALHSIVDLPDTYRKSAAFGYLPITEEECKNKKLSYGPSGDKKVMGISLSAEGMNKYIGDKKGTYHCMLQVPLTKFNPDTTSKYLKEYDQINVQLPVHLTFGKTVGFDGKIHK